MMRYGIVVVILGLSYILLNIVSSQTISRIFYDFSVGKRDAAVEFLKRIKDEPIFAHFYSGVAGFYQENLEGEVYSETLERQRKIEELKEILKLNPKARDALYSLYTLYLQEENTTAADGYLKQAQEIDPDLSGLTPK